MIWKHIFSTFRSKHFKRREPNDANTISIFNFVALKNPMIFFQIFETFVYRCGSIDKNLLERR